MPRGHKNHSIGIENDLIDIVAHLQHICFQCCRTEIETVTAKFLYKINIIGIAYIPVDSITRIRQYLDKCSCPTAAAN